MPRPSLALCLIMKNEAHNIMQLNDSIEGCFDEIHVTDTGSTDGSIELAKSIGWKVHHFEWCDDFAAARNASFEPATTEFIMWMDLDDVLQGREQFIRWRDSAMEFADMWFATYHYSSDLNGNPICSFARERIINRRKGMKWKYEVHEGIIPVPGIRTNYIPTWSVVHKRSEKDTLQDRSRNIKILEKLEKEKSLDNRMTYYYGKELFENGNAELAMKYLEKAIKAEDLELHDRILALQYSAYCCSQLSEKYRAEGKHKEAEEAVALGINLSLHGSQLDPNRAEFFVTVGDFYAKAGRFQEAIPHYAAAKSCKNNFGPGTLVKGPMFSHNDAYTFYPWNQMIKCYCNMGDFEKARKEAYACYELYKNLETKGLIAGIETARPIIHVSLTAKKNDDIVISCPPGGVYEWDADVYKTKNMGGSETAAIEAGFWLHKLTGRKVKIFNTRQGMKEIDGVEYIPNSGLQEYFKDNSPWAHVAWRHNIKLTNAKTYLWCHDLYTPGGETHDNYDKMLCLSPFHKGFVQAMQDIPDEKILLTGNGVRPERFLDGLSVKDENKLIFVSSPDRGLDRAIKVVEMAREIFPKLELHVFYGLENLYKYGLSELAQRLEKMMLERPWVKYHGGIEQKALSQHMRTASVWIHPCDFIETFCISAIENICAGVYPVTRRLGGLADTLALAEKEGMATLLDHDCVTDHEFLAYKSALVDALAKRKWEKVHVDPSRYSWQSVFEGWLPWLGQ